MIVAWQFIAWICSIQIGDPARRGLSDFAAKRLYITAQRALALFIVDQRGPDSADPHISRGN
jgi:hypothetical protein